MLAKNLIIDDDVRSLDANPIPRQADNSLDEICEDRAVVGSAVVQRDRRDYQDI